MATGAFLKKESLMSEKDRSVSEHGEVKDMNVSSGNPAGEQLSALASELLERRGAILEAWRAAGDVGPERNTGSSLSRAQFNDHIPAVLDCLARRIQAWPGERDSVADQLETDKMFEHGLQRWQQGYQLSELIR